MADNHDHKTDTEELTFFKKEIARLHKSFNLKIENILNRIRDRKIQEIKKRIQT